MRRGRREERNNETRASLGERSCSSMRGDRTGREGTKRASLDACVWPSTRSDRSRREETRIDRTRGDASRQNERRRELTERDETRVDRTRRDVSRQNETSAVGRSRPPTGRGWAGTRGDGPGQAHRMGRRASEQPKDQPRQHHPIEIMGAVMEKTGISVLPEHVFMLYIDN